MTPLSQEVGSAFSFDTDECAACVAGSIHLSSEGTICSGLIPGANAGAISRILSVVTIQHTCHGLESVEDQVSVDVGSVV